MKVLKKQTVTFLICMIIVLKVYQNGISDPWVIKWQRLRNTETQLFHVTCDY